MTKIKRLDNIMLEPLEFFNIKEIPVAITSEHSENIRFWLYLRNATIFYEDGHHDSADNIRYRRKLKTEHLSDIGYSMQFCAAVHYGIANKLYWHNPHESNDEVHDFNHDSNGRNILGTRKVKTHFDNYPTVRWKEPKNPNYHFSELGNWLYGFEDIIPLEDMQIGKPFIVDLDVDGFCCHKNIFGVPKGYDGVTGWEKRLENTIRILAGLPKPDLITITLSQGEDEADTYVPREKVEEVKQQTKLALTQLYEDIK